MVTKIVPPGRRRRGRWTDEQLADAVATSSTRGEAMRKLGLKSLSNDAIKRRIEQLGIDVSHLPTQVHGKPMRYPEAALREAVARSTNVTQVIRAFGVRPVGSVHAHVSRKIEQLGISTDHFVRGTTGQPSRRRLTPDDIFVVRHEESTRQSPARLRRALIESGMPYACAECGNAGTWNGKPLSLDIDHINGEWRDNRRGNLRFLCPNCHNQTDTWRSMNHRRRSAVQASPSSSTGRAAG